MRVLRSIVLPPTTLAVLLDPKIAGSGAIRPKGVDDQSIGNETMFLQKLRMSFSAGMVPFRLDQHIEDLALGIDSAPHVGHVAVDLEIDLIQVPACVRLRSACTQVRCDHRPEMDYLAPNGLVGV
jgi:hypothetical protein